MEVRAYNSIERIARDGKGYFRTRDITTHGIHHIYLNRLQEQGKIEKIKRGLYRWVEYKSASNHDTLIQASLAVPKGVICLISALAYHNLTTQVPWEISMAIVRSDKVALPEYPPIKLYYLPTTTYRLGILQVEVDGHTMRVYDKEKTLCDCIKYRRQIGLDVVKESFQFYIKSSVRDLEKIVKYARIVGVEDVVQNYLEVLV